MSGIVKLNNDYGINTSDGIDYSQPMEGFRGREAIRN